MPYLGAKLSTVEITAFTDATYSTVDTREWGDERLYNGHLRLSHSLPLGGELRAAFTGARVQYGETLDGDPTTNYEQQLWSSGTEAEFPIAGRWIVRVDAAVSRFEDISAEVPIDVGG